MLSPSALYNFLGLGIKVNCKAKICSPMPKEAGTWEPPRLWRGLVGGGPSTPPACHMWPSVDNAGTLILLMSRLHRNIIVNAHNLPQNQKSRGLDYEQHACPHPLKSCTSQVPISVSSGLKLLSRLRDIRAGVMTIKKLPLHMSANSCNIAHTALLT